ncbi:hypothetical protein DE146DRAFT_452308 [Phaeosphaeria sp. MPI-PUGE-AT-0046c]|nr:hypothetical protein DE146DRAFT_452308 [Phaeosphaeria sp. MPI-PUGE-AT-0046c]
MSNVLSNQLTPVKAIASVSNRSQHILPVEIIQQIFDYLSPFEINAARHSCRVWMRASLHLNTLKIMLVRGGWSSSSTELAFPAAESQEWSYSRYLSRQCALAFGWTGNGLDPRAAIVEDSNIDLTKQFDGYDVSTGEEHSSLLISVSSCGDFVLIARDSRVDVYDLRSGSLLLLNRLTCPRRVLCMSMDTSSGRHAVALLLESRMGQVCELCRDGDDEGYPTLQAHVFKQFNTVHIQSDRHTLRIRGVNDHHRNEQNLINSS